MKEGEPLEGPVGQGPYLERPLWIVAAVLSRLTQKVDDVETKTVSPPMFEPVSAHVPNMALLNLPIPPLRGGLLPEDKWWRSVLRAALGLPMSGRSRRML